MSSQIVTWVLVVIGWVIVDDRNNARESRKEAKYLIDGIRDKIEQVKDNAIIYHTSNEPSPELSLKIKLQIKNIGERATLLNSYGFQLDVKYVASLRQSITKHNFDTNDFHQLDHNDELLFSIIDCADTMSNNIDCAFLSRYSKCLLERFKDETFVLCANVKHRIFPIYEKFKKLL